MRKKETKQKTVNCPDVNCNEKFTNNRRLQQHACSRISHAAATLGIQCNRSASDIEIEAISDRDVFEQLKTNADNYITPKEQDVMPHTDFITPAHKLSHLAYTTKNNYQNIRKKESSNLLSKAVIVEKNNPYAIIQTQKGNYPFYIEENEILDNQTVKLKEMSDNKVGLFTKDEQYIGHKIHWNRIPSSKWDQFRDYAVASEL